MSATAPTRPTLGLRIAHLLIQIMAIAAFVALVGTLTFGTLKPGGLGSSVFLASWLALVLFFVLATIVGGRMRRAYFAAYVGHRTAAVPRIKRIGAIRWYGLGPVSPELPWGILEVFDQGVRLRSALGRWDAQPDILIPWADISDVTQQGWPRNGIKIQIANGKDIAFYDIAGRKLASEIAFHRDGTGPRSDPF